MCFVVILQLGVIESKISKKVVAMETSNYRKILLLKLFPDKFWERAQIKRIFLGSYNPEAGLIISTQTIDDLIVVIRVFLLQNQL